MKQRDYCETSCRREGMDWIRKLRKTTGRFLWSPQRNVENQHNTQLQTKFDLLSVPHVSAIHGHLGETPTANISVPFPDANWPTNSVHPAYSKICRPLAIVNYRRGRSLAWIRGSNPAGGTDIPCWVLTGTGQSLVQRSPADCGVNMQSRNLTTEADLVRVGLLRYRNKIQPSMIGITCWTTPYVTT